MMEESKMWPKKDNPVCDCWNILYIDSRYYHKEFLTTRYHCRKCKKNYKEIEEWTKKVLPIKD